MGTLYYAVNRELKEAYALGKSSYAAINDLNRKEGFTLEMLKEMVAEEYAGNPNFARIDTDAIAEGLFPYVPFEVVPDYWFDDADLNGLRDVVLTGSRFEGDTDIGRRMWEPR